MTSWLSAVGRALPSVEYGLRNMLVSGSLVQCSLLLSKWISIVHAQMMLWTVVLMNLIHGRLKHSAPTKKMLKIILHTKKTTTKNEG